MVPKIINMDTCLYTNKIKNNDETMKSSINDAIAKNTFDAYKISIILKELNTIIIQIASIYNSQSSYF